MTQTPPPTIPTMPQLLLGILGMMVVGLLVAACSNPTLLEANSSPETAPSSELRLEEGLSSVIDDSSGSPIPNPEDGPEEVTPTTAADRITPLGSAEFELDRLAAEVEQAERLARPSTISIPSLGLDGAGIVAVGVEANGDMEIPPAEQVGWYRFGPRPGEAGSAVLAGHIAYNGVNGAFRYLADLEIGTNFSIGFSDGSTIEYVVTDLQTYLKTELPRDELFEQGGPPRLVLVTCGGSFNYDASSYESNVVAYAVAV